MEPVEQKPIIAVVAVHGVADQEKNASVEETADLLRLHCGYGWAKQTTVRMPVRAISTRFEGEEECPKISKETCFTGETLKRAIKYPDDDAGEEIPLDVRVLRERLANFEPKGSETNHATQRIDLQRVDENGNSTCNCHVFEFYWADLSRLKAMVVQTFVAFFQLLFYLCDLGGRTINFARASFGKKSKSWRVLDWLHTGAHVILALGVPLLNLALFAFAISGIASVLLFRFTDLDAYGGRIVAVLAGFAVAGTVVGCLFSKRAKLSEKTWPQLFWCVAATFILVAALINWLLPGGEVGQTLNPAWVAFTLWLVAGGLVVVAAAVYQRRKRFAATVGLFFVVTITVFFACWLFQMGTPHTGDDFFKTFLNTFKLHVEWFHWILWIGFAVLALCCWALIFTGSILRNLSGGEATSRAKHAGTTVMISLGIPGILILALDLGIWQVVLFGLSQFPESVFAPEWIESIKEVFYLSIPVGTFWGSLAIGVAIGFALWLLTPAVVAEKPSSNLGADDTPEKARWLGRILSNAFTRLRLSGTIFYTLATFGLITGAILWLISRYTPIGRSMDAHAVLLTGLCVYLFFAIRKAGIVLRNVLDVALDVVNWMRHDPPGNTPSAHIASRFASQMQHLADWRDPETGRGYDEIVIFAHSLGSVLMADLLRYLKHAKEPDLPPNNGTPVTLFTMGSPLWQMHSLRFPDQYGWARDCEATSWETAKKPNPAELSVKWWSNFYRSGDYVGRSLWHSDAGSPETGAWDPELHEDSENRRRERCIGSGAHTHYWDDTAPAIAQELDFLIGLACADSHKKLHKNTKKLPTDAPC